ncbi:MAG: hypothetical protein JNJ54_20490 [Myxococcaceae bacterium]|nr:hypothetical protein [Myxococcaceae bacterium]
MRDYGVWRTACVGARADVSSMPPALELGDLKVSVGWKRFVAPHQLTDRRPSRTSNERVSAPSLPS